MSTGRQRAAEDLRDDDLRATFVTIALATGKTEAWVTQRTGHTTSQQLRNYQRDATTLRELSVGELTPLNEAIPELRDALLSGEVAGLEMAPESQSALARASARNDEVGHDRLELSANGLRVPDRGGSVWSRNQMFFSAISRRWDLVSRGPEMTRVDTRFGKLSARYV